MIKAKVREAAVRVCMTEPCATVKDIMTETRRPQRVVRQELEALAVERRVTLTKRQRQLWVNPLNEDGSPLVCGVWCAGGKHATT